MTSAVVPLIFKTVSLELLLHHTAMRNQWKLYIDQTSESKSASHLLLEKHREQRWLLAMFAGRAYDKQWKQKRGTRNRNGERNATRIHSRWKWNDCIVAVVMYGMYIELLS